MKRYVLSVVLVVGLVTSAVLVQTGRVPSLAPLAPPGLIEPAEDPDDHARIMSKFLTARYVAREAIAREVLSNRLTMVEAAAVFAWLDDQQPVVPQSLMSQGRGAHHDFVPDLVPASREEWLCLRAAECARHVARFETPERASELHEELEAKLRRAWASGETKTLPAVSEHACRCLLNRAIAAVEAFTALGPIPAVPARDLRLITRPSVFTVSAPSA